MKIIRKIFSWLLKLLIGFFFLILLYLLIAIVLTLIPVNSDFSNASEGTAIYVRSNGVHTDIIIPTQSTQYAWIRKLGYDKNIKYLAFGWGDKEFYMNTPGWSDIKITTAFKAAFLPTTSVLQVYGLRTSPSITKRTRKIILTDEQLQHLSNYIYDSFILDKYGYPVEILDDNGVAIYRYFESKRKYTLFYTCNNWVNQGLKSAGVKNSIWTPFDKSVLYYLK